MDLCVDRQPFVDQSQSMNLFFSDYTFDEFTSAQFYAWEKRLKTGSYYIRTKAAAAPQKFTVDPRKQQQLVNFGVGDNLDVQDDAEICLLCSA